MARKPVTYWDYTKVDRILELQTGVEGDETKLENDEVMFIVVHQIDELWFKLVLRELVSVRNLFAQPRVPEQALSSAVRGIRRMALLFGKAASHFDLMETMTTRDYLGFRDKLSPASGFQSAQLREIEILMGLSADDRIPLGHEKSYLEALKNPGESRGHAYDKVQKRLSDLPSLLEAVDSWLYRTPIQGSTPDDAGDEKAVAGFIDAYLGAHRHESQKAMELAVHDAMTDEDKVRLKGRFEKEIQGAAAFLKAEDVDPEQRAKASRIRAAVVYVESYRELPLLAWPREVLDGIVALEQAMLVFRQRHARMVERIIGRRTGTGGSAGVDYLDRTALGYRVFRDIWATRTVLLKREALPAVERREVYGLSPEG